MRHLGMLVCPRVVAVYTCGRADFENEIRLFCCVRCGRQLCSCGRQLCGHLLALFC